MQAHELVITGTFHDWKSQQPEAVVHKDDEFEAHVIPGYPGMEGDGGAVLWWTDHVINEWAEWFPDFPTALVRLAALIRCVETEEFFKDGPGGFVRWSENFFTQTVSAPRPSLT